MIQKAIEAAKRNLKLFPEVAPVFFIGHEHDIKIVQMPFDGEAEKQLATIFIRKIAQDIEADFILFIAESWSLQCPIIHPYGTIQRLWRSWPSCWRHGQGRGLVPAGS
jgi:hypothetical protein